MRALTALLLFAVPLSVFGQMGDARLSAPTTFDSKYLALSDFAAAITRTTQVKIVVDRPIVDRKVAIFAERPANEIMTRIADTLFLEWVPEGDGYRLRLQPEVAKEERAMTAEEDRLEREALLRSVRKASEHGRKSFDLYREAYRQAKADLEASRRDTTDAGRRRTMDLAKTLGEDFPRQDRREGWERGRVFNQLSEGQISGMLNGQPIFASTASISGAVRMPTEATVIFSEMGITRPTPIKDLLLIGYYDRGTRSLIFRYRELGGRGGVSTHYAVEPLKDYFVNLTLETLPLANRLREWAKVKDEGVLNQKLDREVERPQPHATDLMTLSDALRWIHLKSGVPIVADAFRVSTGYADLPAGGTVAEFLARLKPPQYGPISPLPSYFHSENGWLTARHGRYWRRLRGEVAESRIVPLEQKAATTPLSMDDYATFAASLSPEQVESVRNSETFLVSFPTFALVHGTAPLRLWAALPAPLRATAQRQGLALSSLRGPSLTAAREFIANEVLRRFPGEVWLPGLISTGGGMPEGSVLWIHPATPEKGMGFTADIKVHRPNESYTQAGSSFAGWFFSMGTAPDFTLEATLPLYPKKD